MRRAPDPAAITAAAPRSRWSEVLLRVQREGGPDNVRRDALKALAAHTGRPTIVYATAFHAAEKAQFAAVLGLDISAVSGFREVTNDLPAGPLDVILHTPGGVAEAVEAVVSLLRSKFNDVRYLVPLAAKSAGTMIAMSGDQIVLLRGAELGPIDPQVIVRGRFSPARAIEKQFEQAVAAIKKDATEVPAWVPLLSTLGPSLLEECRTGLELSQGLVAKYLADYMFHGQPDAQDHAKAVAQYLANYDEHLSHGRRVSVEELKPKGVAIAYADEIDKKLDELIGQAWVTIDFTLTSTACLKMFENHFGQGIFNQQIAEVVQIAPMGAPAKPAR